VRDIEVLLPVHSHPAPERGTNWSYSVRRCCVVLACKRVRALEDKEIGLPTLGKVKGAGR
jgi:hypothetical protein